MVLGRFIRKGATMTSVLITLAIYGSLAIAANVFLALWLTERSRRIEAEAIRRELTDCIQQLNLRDQRQHKMIAAAFNEVSRLHARNAKMRRAWLTMTPPVAVMYQRFEEN